MEARVAYRRGQGRTWSGAITTNYATVMTQKPLEIRYLHEPNSIRQVVLNEYGMYAYYGGLVGAQKQIKERIDTAA